MNDLREIMDLGSKEPTERKKKISKPKEFQPKRPEGVNRELYALLVADGCKNFNTFAEMLPSEKPGGYQKKIQLGARKVRKWLWTPFKNPARKDQAIFHHWRRENDDCREYPFAKFNKEIPIPQYTNEEYAKHLVTESWTRAGTDHLFDLCKRFDLRFQVICDRWDSKTYGKKSVEDIKERYYNILSTLAKQRSAPGTPEPKPVAYDAEHERRRKEQLKKLWDRTPEQIEEEEYLRAELKKIEVRKKEREKKTQDLQKLITAADVGVGEGSAASSTNNSLTLNKKSLTEPKKATTLAAKRKSGKGLVSVRGRDPGTLTSSSDVFLGIKWPDVKSNGVFARSQKMKLPNSVGQKKLKAIEQILNQLEIDLIQIATEENVTAFNELRSEIVLLYELKSALATCLMEIHSIRSQCELINGEKLEVPPELVPEGSSALVKALEACGTKTTLSTTSSSSSAPSFNVSFSQPSTPATPQPSNQNSSTLSSSLETIDLDIIVPGRKRKAALEQGNVLKKLKAKM